MALAAVESPPREEAPIPLSWEFSVRTCRAWLRWQNPNQSADGMTPTRKDTIIVTGDFGVPSSRYDRQGGPGSEIAVGNYRLALMGAQLHWAAAHLPPMLRDAAFAARRERRAGVIIGMLAREHRSEWLRHRYQWPAHPLKALLARTAVAMASSIEEEGWP